MNHDEPKSNSDQNPGIRPWIEPELEARVVAWVAGEASAFEIAELERLMAEKPELAIFKRRIEAVHGLMGEAVRPDREPVRLSEERRAKLLAMIGPSTQAALTPARHNMTVIPSRSGDSPWSRRRPHIYFAFSAAAAVAIVALVLLPGRLMEDKRTAAISSVASDKRRLERVTRAEPNSKPAIPQSAAPALFESEPPLALTMQNRRPTSESRDLRANKVGKQPDANGIATDGQTMVRGTPLKNEDAEKGRGLAGPVVQLDAFVVSESREGTATAISGAATAPAIPWARAGALPLLEQSSLTLGSAATKPASSTLAAQSGMRGSSRGVALGASMPDGAGVVAVDQLNVADSLGQARQVNSGEARAFSFSDLPQEAARASGELFASFPSAPPPVASVTFGEVTSRAKSDPATAPADAGSGASGTATNPEPVATTALNPNVVTLSAFSVTSPKTKDLDHPTRDRADDVGTRAVARAYSGAKRSELKEEQEKKVSDPAARAESTAAGLETETAREPVSTFSLHVSDVSFRLAVAAAAAFERGQDVKMPAVRPEEFYNAFDYGDPTPAPADKIGARMEQSVHPVLQQRNLLRIAVKVPATGRGAGQPLRLTVLLDTSGSMEREDRRIAVRRALEELIALLGPNDRVTLIGFARQPRLLAEAVPGHQAGHLVDVSARTPAEGGTNLEQALKLAGELALRHQLSSAQNRIVLLTDGAANLGNADPAQLAGAIEKLRQQGIAFDACGIGLEGVGDNILEALTRKGDGRYYVIDRPEAADAAFARQLAGAFRPAAENVKLQVRFNPARVGKHRLIGFEQHRLREEDFRNDKVDAAELAAEEAATALYQIEVLPQGTGEIGEVYVRFRDVATGAMVERSWTIRYDAQAPRFERATPSLQLAGVAALLAEKLSDSPIADHFKLGDLSGVVSNIRGHYAHEARVQELVMLYGRLRRISGE